MARLGYAVGEVIACERRGAARQVHAHAVQQLHKEFPDLVANRTGAQLHHRLPQDIQLVGAEQLEALGPIDLVVAGWPCQGRSAAGKGGGLDDDMSGLFTELVRVMGILQALHRRWGRPLGYVIEHVAAGFDRRPTVQEHYAAARGLLGPDIVFVAAQVGSRAHRLRAWWTNLEGTALLRAAIKAQKRPAGLFVHHVLGPGRQAKPPQPTGTAPWACVEKPGQPRCALNTFLSYKGLYAFSRGGGGVLRCTNAAEQVTWEKPTAEERELAMGFPREFTQCGLSEATRCELLGQAMDLNALMWLLGACKEGGRCRAKSFQLGGDGDKETESGVGVLVSAAAVRATGEPDGGAARGGSGGSEKEKDEGARKGPASSGLSTGAFTVGGVADRSTPGGWLVGAQLEETEKQRVAQVVEKNKEVFAFFLEEIGEFKLFEVQLDLKTDQPIYERRRKHSLRE
jgi:hypothetical protein